MFVKLFTSLFFTFFIYSFTFSQTTLKGTIKDKKGNPIPFATIFLKNSRKGAISSDNGEFTLISKFKGADTLSVTAVVFDSY